MQKIINMEKENDLTTLIIGNSEKTNYGSLSDKQKTINDEILPPTNTIRLKYPIAVYFVLASKFFEAFAANGVRTILALFLRDTFCFSESISTVILHVFNFFSQFCPIFGAILADNYFGNIQTVFYFFFIYALGYIGIILLMFDIYVFPVRIFLITSLILIAIGNGSIRACVTSLGGAQFQVPEQSKSLFKYFSQYYFIYYIGILFGKIIPPTVRRYSPSYEYCSTYTETYSRVFEMFGILFFLSWLFFMIGRKFYKTEVPNNSNIFGKSIDCMCYAIWVRIKGYKNKNWLDGSIGRYSRSFVRDVGILIKVVKMCLPLSIYYALLAQQDSTWTFQSSQMNTMIYGVYIEPDQFKSIGPILLLILIPIWSKIVNPLLKKANIEINPFLSIVIGGLCAITSFAFAALLQWHIYSNQPYTITALYQMPQFLFLMLGEVFLSIPALQFVYTEAPNYMKSLFTAFWFINNAIGNLIVVFITEFNFIENPVWEYLLYACLMFVAIIIFIFISSNYELVNYDENNDSVNSEDQGEEKTSSV